MGRARSREERRSERVSTALSAEEVARLVDEPRGAMVRSEYFRWCLILGRRHAEEHGTLVPQPTNVGHSEHG
jgi:hypothetical protein